MSPTKRKWLNGLIGAVLNSAATAVTLLVIDPIGFSEWDRLGKAVLTMAVVGAALYMKQNPPPYDEY